MRADPGAIAQVAGGGHGDPRGWETSRRGTWDGGGSGQSSFDGTDRSTRSKHRVGAAAATKGGHGYDSLVSTNPGVPSRTPRERRPQSGDALSGPVDSSRPANPWPRLLAFGAFVVAMFVLAGTCVVSFANAPDREIRVRHSEYEEGLPRFLAITSMGYDAQNRTFGAFLAVPLDASPTVAVLSRDPDSGCNVLWEATTPSGATRGIYVDPCSDARYAFDGTALHVGATRDLHRLDVVREVTGYVVSFEEFTLGTCRNGATEGCSIEGEPIRRPLPKNELTEDFGN